MCVNGSAPQINGAAGQVREHIEEATELLEEMQKANGTLNSILCWSFLLILCRILAKTRIGEA